MPDLPLPSKLVRLGKNTPLTAKVRVQMTVMIDAGTMTAEQLNALKADIGCMDWAALHEITQGGEDPASFLDGGFNPVSLKISSDGCDWREIPMYDNQPVDLALTEEPS